jgi:hypothetical protein
MEQAVYVLCALTSLTCAVLLFRAYRRTKVRLLLWSTLCFVGLVLSNLMLIVDLIVFPRIDLSIPRVLPTLLGLLVLIYGFIQEDV